MTRYDLLKRWGQRPAAIHGGSATAYRQLESDSCTVARRLVALGVTAGDRVATTLPPGPDFLALLHATPRLGAALVPLNTRLAAAERRWQLEDSGARLVVEEPLLGQEGELPSRAFDPAAPHTVLYTSGTSARPKRVELTLGNHLASAVASGSRLPLGEGDRWLCVLPLFHVGGLAILLRSALAGSAAIVHDGFDAGRVRDALEGGEATVVSLVPTMLRRLRDAGLPRAPGLRAALLGGAPAPRDLLEWAAETGLPVVQTYGMTETASQIATLGVEEALERSGSAGRPLPGVNLRIGDGGEILVRGPMVARGALGEDGWLRTGDAGRLDDDGFLWVEGRLKDVIVSGGENVSAAEVEDALLAHPAVRDAAVAGSPDPEWGEAVTAWVVMAGDADLDAHCRALLAPYKVPKAFHRVGEIPRGATGKVLRSRLPRP